MCFSPDKVLHVSGKANTTADALSRSPVDKPEDTDVLALESEFCAETTVHHLPATSTCLQIIRDAQHADEETAEIIGYCQCGWMARIPTQLTCSIAILQGTSSFHLGEQSIVV